MEELSIIINIISAIVSGGTTSTALKLALSVVVMGGILVLRHFYQKALIEKAARDAEIAKQKAQADAQKEAERINSEISRNETSLDDFLK